MINLAPICETVVGKAIETPSLNYKGCTVQHLDEGVIECRLSFSDGSVLSERYEWPLGSQGLEVVKQLINESIAKLMQGRLDFFTNLADEKVCH